jgi:hypothetical protein
MKKLNKNLVILLVFTFPLALFAQPSEYVRDAKTKVIAPTEQKKNDISVQATKPQVEVSAKNVSESVIEVTVTPQVAPVEVQAKGVVEPVEENIALMRFEKKTINFGTVKMGEHPSHVFSYTNKGQEPVEIEIVSACDCTELEYSKKPIAVGGTGFIKATYMSERAPENVNKEFEKEITIVLKNKYPDTGYPIVETLKIKGSVIE